MGQLMHYQKKIVLSMKLIRETEPYKIWKNHTIEVNWLARMVRGEKDCCH